MLIQPRREDTTRKLGSETERVDSPQKYPLSKTLASSSSTANSVRHRTSFGSGSGSRVVALEGKTHARGSGAKDGILVIQMSIR
jgi:hypothetical protein